MEFLRALSTLANTICGGYSTETLCGRCYRLRHKSRLASLLVAFFNIMFFWDTNHCRSSHVSDSLITDASFSRPEALKLAKEIVRR